MLTERYHRSRDNELGFFPDLQLLGPAEVGNIGAEPLARGSDP